MKPFVPFAFTDETVDELPPRTLEILFAVQPVTALNMVLSLAHHPVMAEAALRAFEAGVFELEASKADDFRRAIGNHKFPDFIRRFDAVRDKAFLATGENPIDRSLSAIQGRNQIFFERSILDLGDLNGMIDRKSLPAGTRLPTKIFDNADKANAIFMSKGATLLLASSKNEYSLNLEGQTVIDAGLDLKGIAVRLESRKLGAVEYNHADLIVRTARPKELMTSALRSSSDKEATKAIFSKALDDLIESRVRRARLNATNSFHLHEIDEIKDLVVSLTPLGAYPSKKALETQIKVRWSPDRGAAKVEEFEGPLLLCMPGRGFGVKPKPNSPETPISLWTLMAANGLLDELKAFAWRGEDLSASNPVNGFNALHGAAQSGRIDVVDFLMQNGLDERVKDVFGDTPKKWWQDRTMKPVNEFDSAMQVSKARRAVDGILTSVGQNIRP
jgi:hypothetical protein